MMNRQFDLRADAALFRYGLALLVLLGWMIATANGQENLQPEASTGNSSIRATHVLGLEGVHRNASGKLSIPGDGLRFQADGTPATQVSIASIQNISLGNEDKQVGGVPMMLGKAAAPYVGGRVVSLFSHKKYDILTIEYLDANGGLHGALFILRKGQGEDFRNQLIAGGAHSAPLPDAAPPPGATEIKTAAAPAVGAWSVQVDRIDPGAVNLAPSFGAAIYENLLEELAKKKQFSQVFRSGDRSANDISGLLVLKTKVQKYTPGSETRRAVTTVAGATKLNVHIQLLTRDGRLLLEQDVEGDVRFIGSNLRATHNLAHNVVRRLKQSTLSQPAGTAPEQQSLKTSKYQTITAVPSRQATGVTRSSVGSREVRLQQDLLRHSSARLTLDTYTQAVPSAKRDAQNAVVRLVSPSQSGS